MDFQTLLDKYSPFIKQHKLPLILASLGVIFFVYGLIVLIGSTGESDDIKFEPADQQVEGVKSAVSQQITIDVEGAVINQGVYHLSSDSRIRDALVAAGGLSAGADREWVAKNINLAAKLTDGGKIYIPKAGEGSVESKGDQSSGLVNINSAGEKELDTLPGVGSAIAQKIINSRPYSSIEELLTKKAVSSKVFEQIKDKITAY